jgi:hypothetical protein
MSTGCDGNRRKGSNRAQRGRIVAQSAIFGFGTGRQDMENDERATLRRSLGFSDAAPGDTFTELGRRGHGHDTSNGNSPAIGVEAFAAAPMERIERELSDLAAAVGRLTAQVGKSNMPVDVRYQLAEVARSQASLVERLTAVEREVYLVIQAGLDKVSARLDSLEKVTEGEGGRRSRLDLLRRQSGRD